MPSFLSFGPPWDFFGSIPLSKYWTKSSIQLGSSFISNIIIYSYVLGLFITSKSDALGRLFDTKIANLERRFAQEFSLLRICRILKLVKREVKSCIL